MRQNVDNSVPGICGAGHFWLLFGYALVHGGHIVKRWFVPEKDKQHKDERGRYKLRNNLRLRLTQGPSGGGRGAALREAQQQRLL